VVQVEVTHFWKFCLLVWISVLPVKNALVAVIEVWKQVLCAGFGFMPAAVVHPSTQVCIFWNWAFMASEIGAGLKQSDTDVGGVHVARAQVAPKITRNKLCIVGVKVGK